MQQVISAPGLSPQLTQVYTYGGVSGLNLATENPVSATTPVCLDAASHWCVTECGRLARIGDPCMLPRRPLTRHFVLLAITLPCFGASPSPPGAASRLTFEPNLGQ